MNEEFLEIFCATTIAVMGSERFRDLGDHMLPGKIANFAQVLYAQYKSEIKRADVQMTHSQEETDKVMYDRNKKR